MATEVDLQAALAHAIEWAQTAGTMIKQAWRSDGVTIEYKSSIDLVTEVDKAVEDYIMAQIKKTYPEHAVLGEESASAQGAYSLEAVPTWCVDPIDGTTNFVHHFPFSCVSIGFCIDRTPVLGVVFNPILNELFSAVRGGGAFLNGEPIHVSAATSIDRSVISTNVGFVRDAAGIEFILENMKALLTHNVRSMRSLGSSALEVCLVACGRIDAFYEFGIHPWDIAAAVCILREAGGVAMDPDGRPLDLTRRRILAAAPGLIEPISQALNTHPPFLPQ
jgi:inositol-phosphate phosphatase/L-galactose 1-phosphate phosphatase